MVCVFDQPVVLAAERVEYNQDVREVTGSVISFLATGFLTTRDGSLTRLPNIRDSLFTIHRFIRDSFVIRDS